MLTESTNSLTYQKLSKEEMESRGILGRLVGVCADFISPTRNGRKYPEKLWENVFNDEIMKERIANGVCFGELGHPADREETDMEKICICMPEEPKKGPDGKLRAVFDILDTPNGRILKSLCDYGSTLGISSRGSGDLETGFDGQESVNPDTYNCEGFDVVLLPGVKDARLQYVTESLNTTKDNKTLREKLTESINSETKDHQKTIRESLASLGIKLDEGKYQEYDSSKASLTDHKWVGKYIYDNKNNIYQIFEVDEAGPQTYINCRDVDHPDLPTYTRFNADTDFEDGTIRWAKKLNEEFADQIDLDESWNNLNTYLTEARLSLAQKLDAWHEGTRKLRIKGYSDLDLWMIYELCLDKGYDEQAQLVKKELESRGVYDDVEVVMTEDKSALFITYDYAGKAFIRDLNIPNFDPPRKVWDVRHGILGYRIKKDDPEADAVVRALIPILKGKQQNEEFTLSESYSWEDLAELVPVLSGPADFKESYINESKMTADEKMAAWHAGTRRENIKACSDKKLYDYLTICADNGYDDEYDIIVKELDRRGKWFVNNKIYAKMMAGGSELWILENGASNSFFNNFYDDDEEWGFEQGWLLDEPTYNGWWIIKKTDKDAMRIAYKLLPLLQKQGLTEGYLDADRSVLKIIKSDKEYGLGSHVRGYVPDYSAIPDGTVITARGLNPWHSVYATYEKISEDNWLETYYVEGEKQWTSNLTNHQLASELHNVELNESAISRETDDNIDEAQLADDNDMAIVNELQESLKLNKKLDEKIVTLQERLSASYAKEMELNEAIDSYKIRITKLSNKAKEHKALTEKLSKLERELKNSNDEVSSKKNTLHETMRRDATERKSLQESISKKDEEIAKLTEQLNNIKKEVKATNESVESLSEQLEIARKDTKQIKEKYTTKLEQSNALIEKYKNIAKKAVDKYIDKQATVLGVSSNEVKNRLPESYSFTDIDNVCESLREYKVNMNSLPFNTSKLNENVNLSVKNIDNRTLVRNADDEISDTDLKLAEKFMK